MFNLAKFAPMMVGQGGSSNDITLMGAINTAGLTSNLKVCLDAGDALSWAGSGDWEDRSGNGYGFDLGGPTFTGSVGDTSSSTYWSFDGTDQFSYDSPNETWMNSLHKDNSIFTFIMSVYIPLLAGVNGLIGTQSSTSGVGIRLGLLATEKLQLAGRNDSGTLISVSADTALSTSAWHIIGVSLNEPAGASGSFFYTDGAYSQVSAANTFNGTFTTPSTASASADLAIGAIGEGGGLNLENGCRVGFVGMWQGTALSKANFDSIYDIVKSRYGLS